MHYIELTTAEIAHKHKVSQRTAQRWKRDGDSRCRVAADDAEGFTPQSVEIVRSPANEALWRLLQAAAQCHKAAEDMLGARAALVRLWDSDDDAAGETINDGCPHLGSAMKFVDLAAENANTVLSEMIKYDTYQKFSGYPHEEGIVPPPATPFPGDK